MVNWRTPVGVGILMSNFELRFRHTRNVCRGRHIPSGTLGGDILVFHIGRCRPTACRRSRLGDVMNEPKPPTTIVTAYAEPASGPGWSNAPIWVITRDGNNVLHQECIQPDAQTPEMAALYAVSTAANASMVRLIEAQRRKRR